MSRDSFVSILTAWMRRENLALCRTSDPTSPLVLGSEEMALTGIVDLILDANGVFNSPNAARAATLDMVLDASKTIDIPVEELQRLVAKCEGAQ